MIPRHLTSKIREALGDTPVALIGGARQTGKTTLAQSLIGDAFPATYISLDDSALTGAAQADPAGFIAGLGLGPVILDEAQHAPSLFPAIKASVDRDRRPGRFLLTGSANVLLLPKLSESLAGRMEVLVLWPLSQSEIEGVSKDAIAALFAPAFPPVSYEALSRAELSDRLLKGGFPEPLSRPSSARRRAWHANYLTTLLQRDVLELSRIEGLTRLPRLLQLLAARTASLLNLSDISGTGDIPYATLHRYMALLEATYLVHLVPAWSSNLGLRLVKSPKLLLCDTGLISALLNLDESRLEAEPTLFGALLETFVAMELKKLIGWSEEPATLWHFRTHARQEVDLVLEHAGGRLVGIEVKAAASLSAGDFKGLRVLQGSAGQRFVRGIVFYTGSQILPYGERLYGVPVSFLWEGETIRDTAP
ncbi:MAG: ATP-binding protein [Armatimonadetes bacterium]|nr:ATP-binding protein [Armatimonadota bacterium]